MPKVQLDRAFKKSKQLSQLYKTGKLDSVIAQFSSIIHPEFYLGGHKCSAFKLPGLNQVYKLSLKNIRYFKNGYCDKFRLLCSKPSHLLPNDPLFFFQYHINSMPLCYAPIKEILYEDNDVFLYTQDYCTPVRKYQTVKGETVFDPLIVVQILELIINLFRKNNLVTEIGTHNIGFVQSNKNKDTESNHNSHLVLFDYDTIRPLKEAIMKKPSHWWGSQVGDLLNYLSHVFCPNSQKWYHKYRKYWRHHPNDLVSITEDFPSYVIDLIDSYINPIDDVDQQISTMIHNLNRCRKQILMQVEKPHTRYSQY